MVNVSTFWKTIYDAIKYTTWAVPNIQPSQKFVIFM